MISQAAGLRVSSRGQRPRVRIRTPRGPVLLEGRLATLRNDATTFSLTIHPPRSGWLQFDLQFGDQSHSFNVSHLGHAIVPLVRAASQVAERRGQSAPADINFDWQDEPGAWRWYISPDGDTLLVSIDQFPRTFPDRNATGSRVLQWRIPSRRFCTSVLRAVDSLLSESTEEQLSSDWIPERPAVAVEHLRRMLNAWPASSAR